MTKALPAYLLLLLTAALFGIVYAEADTEERQVESFSKLRVQNGVDVHLTQADREALRIEVDGIGIEDVVTEVVDDELRITRAGGALGRFLSTGRVSAYIDFVRLSDIEVSGGSDVRGRSTIEADELRVVASGGSDVRLTVDASQLEFRLSGGSDLDVEGRADDLSVDASGGSDVSAGRLRAQRASVRVSGGSDASVNAAARVDIEASGGSDVDVHGDPRDRTVDTDRSSDVTWK
ncbi:MAG: DUF2807 domain-containing protein [Gammaproteobacteria bacterium]|nr:DUF2807 domain-containing protein [Gammaproteobacteria bacterium]